MLEPMDDNLKSIGRLRALLDLRENGVARQQDQHYPKGSAEYVGYESIAALGRQSVDRFSKVMHT